MPKIVKGVKDSRILGFKWKDRRKKLGTLPYF